MGNIAGWIEDAAGALDKASARRRPRMPTVEVRTQFVPYPLCGVISPWNAPMMLALLDAVPALFAGCAVLLKPSEITPRLTGPLFESVRAVPELAAVFDFVTGDADTGKAVIDQADVICFTGSVPTGRKIAVHCAERLIPCYLELGGKDPVIVTETADLARAATAVLRGAAHANGMVCFSVERIYVAESIHDAFVTGLVEKAKAVRLNCDNPRAGHLHPFTFAPQAEIVQRHLADAVAKGASILTGGNVETHDGGLYMRPTVLTNVTHDMLIMQEETFGPCLPVMKFGDIEEAIHRLKNGHCRVLFTEDLLLLVLAAQHDDDHVAYAEAVPFRPDHFESLSADCEARASDYIPGEVCASFVSRRTPEDKDDVVTAATKRRELLRLAMLYGRQNTYVVTRPEGETDDKSVGCTPIEYDPRTHHARRVEQPLPIEGEILDPSHTYDVAIVRAASCEDAKKAGGVRIARIRSRGAFGWRSTRGGGSVRMLSDRTG